MSDNKSDSKPPVLSAAAHHLLSAFETHLRDDEDLSPLTLRAYLADLRQFAHWCEATWAGDPGSPSFLPEHLTTPLITRYRSELQGGRGLKPASVNRALVSLKRLTAWAQIEGRVSRDPARPVRFVRQTPAPPRGLNDREEQALVRAVMAHGPARDQTLIVLMLHTGLRAHEVCALRRRDLHLAKRSGTLRVTGKGNKVREVPLNITAREVLGPYLETLPPGEEFIFPSVRRAGGLTTRALDHLIRKYAHLARAEVSPHDLRHRFGYVMAEKVPLHRLAQLMGHDSLDTTLRYVRATQQDLQGEMEKIAWR